MPFWKKSEGTDRRMDDLKDEILEAMWTARELGESSKEKILSQADGDGTRGVLSEMERDGWVASRGEELFFLPKGETLARELMRRHRLAETLFSCVLELPDGKIHAQACELEHERVLSQETTACVCAFLGHPPACPHGKPIPPGECCRRFQREVQPLVIPLVDGEVGEVYRIVFVSHMAHQSLDRLVAFGVHPGKTVTIHQRKPAYVLAIDESQVAIEEALAKHIFVKRTT